MVHYISMSNVSLQTFNKICVYHPWHFSICYIESFLNMPKVECEDFQFFIFRLNNLYRNIKNHKIFDLTIDLQSTCYNEISRILWIKNLRNQLYYCIAQRGDILCIKILPWNSRCDLWGLPKTWTHDRFCGIIAELSYWAKYFF